MATLNTSNEGPAITRSYRSVVDAPAPSSASPTYAKWVVLHAAAPLASAFQQDAGKESVLKVQSTGEGELQDLIDEFNDGRIQYAYAKIKDPNSSLPKSVLIAWCGEGVPERTKGYFTTHTATVSKLLHGYHVQVTARNDRDLTPENIIRKVADSSGSKYSGDSTPSGNSSGPPPPVASKPVFQPSRVGGAAAGFKPLGSTRSRAAVTNAAADDDDGWGADAPHVNRSQLEKVESAYKPTKVNMAELTSQRQEPSRFQAPASTQSNGSDVVKGGYQPIGKVDIAAIRRQAQESGSTTDDRPTTVKGAYEPIGKVDIAAIRAKAQGPGTSESSSPAPVSSAISPDPTGASDSEPKSLAERSAAFSQPGRMTSLPKPKVAPKFGASAFSGTKAPAPGGFEAKTAPKAAPVGVASRTFADEGGKTPAQIWAERKARERGDSGASASIPPPAAPVESQTSGSGQWQSGYSGKKWAPVATTKTGGSALSNDRTGEEPPAQEDSTTQDEAPSGGVSSIRDRFKGAAPIGVSPGGGAPVPPPMDFSSKPNAGASRGVPIPGLPQRHDDEVDEDAPSEEKRVMPPPPAQPPRPDDDEEEEEEDEDAYRPSSPIRLAQPVSRSEPKEMEPAEELHEEPAVPAASLARAIPQPKELEEEPQVEQHDPARAAAQAAAEASLGSRADVQGAQQGGKSARAEYDYEKAEDNELEFAEGEVITNIDMVDEDWWMGTNSKGDSGLFPANYVTLLEDDSHAAAAEHAVHVPEPEPEHVPAAPTATHESHAATQTATAEYDYEAQEDNELSFPEGAIITDVEFPDEDWWSGKYNGKEGLFPANYTKLNG